MNVNWMLPDWAYLLGVIHGDGHISKRSVSVSVSYKDSPYADVLISLWRNLGFNPKIYRPRSAMRIDVHSSSLRDVFAKFKTNMRWSWPNNLLWPHYLAGVIDTDGCVTLNKSVIITLKRTGNLVRLATELNGMGIREVNAKNTTSRYKGEVYETECITITGMDRIIGLFDSVELRHPRKQQRLRAMLGDIQDIRSRVPLWKRIGLWLQLEGPKTWKEIAGQFNITQEQYNSAMGKLRISATVEAIPPPEALTQYRVSGL